MTLSPFTATVSDSAEEGYCSLRLDYVFSHYNLSFYSVPKGIRGSLKSSPQQEMHRQHH